MNFFPLENKPIKRKQRNRTETVALHREDIPVDFFTDEELYAAKGGILVFDAELYVNYFLVGFRCFYTDKIVYFERTSTTDFDCHKLLWVLHNFCIVGFNSNTFDIPILWLALQGASTETLKNVANFIIKENWRPGDIERAYKFKMGVINTIDLIEVAPLQASLKAYAGRLHARRLQELPYPPDKVLTSEEINKVRNYNFTDLEDTLLLLNELSPQLELRSELSKQYKTDLRSKSDAQVAEAVICNEIKRLSDYYPKKTSYPEGHTVKYNLPDFIKFETPRLNKVLKDVINATFTLDALGSPVWPEGLGVKEEGKDNWVLKVEIGNAIYKVGMGGLHSSEKNIAHYATEDIEIADNDVESFYPRIILNQLLAPEHLKQYFIQVYDSIVEKRLEAKHLAKKYKKEGNKEKATYYKRIADSLKIVINGSFGKLGNKYSALYAPQLMLQVTLTGQLVLLMLIEKLELASIEVISGNTDGVVSKYNKNRREEVRSIISMWEKQTSFKTEETKYLATFNRDVNNYFVIKEEGEPDARFLDEIEGLKVKGCYCERGSALNSVLSKNPATLICSDAIIKLLSKQIPIEQTITSCKDIRRFISIIKVTGGGEKNGIYLGKTVRFYYAKGITGCINRVANGNKVPKTDNGKPCQDMPLSFPTDIDYEKYIALTTEILFEIGYLKAEKQQKFF